MTNRIVQPRNFLVSYSGRVGSTALLDSLKLLPNFDIPIFEELDAWYVDVNKLYDGVNEENVDKVIDETYELHRAAGVSVGFKWRIWGNIDKVAEVLRKHDVIIFNLVRSDALEYIASLYLTNIVNKEFNAPQFLLKDASSEEEKLKILFRYRIEKHEVDLAQYRELFEQELQRERERIDLLRRLHAAENTILTIFYEDFAYKRYRFLSALLRLLGHPPMVSWPDPQLRKVANAYPSEQLTNRSELCASDWLVSALHLWDEAITPSDFPLLTA
jgi:hypothetical protein